MRRVSRRVVNVYLPVEKRDEPRKGRRNRGKEAERRPIRPNYAAGSSASAVNKRIRAQMTGRNWPAHSHTTAGPTLQLPEHPPLTCFRGPPRHPCTSVRHCYPTPAPRASCPRRPPPTRCRKFQIRKYRTAPRTRRHTPCPLNQDPRGGTSGKSGTAASYSRLAIWHAPG